MFVKLTRSGSRSYVKLVEAYRDEAGVARQRVVATLGRLEQVRAGAADALVRGLRRVVDGEDAASAKQPDVRFAAALAVGDTWLLSALWHKLGFGDAFRRVLRSGRFLRLRTPAARDGVQPVVRPHVQAGCAALARRHAGAGDRGEHRDAPAATACDGYLGRTCRCHATNAGRAAAALDRSGPVGGVLRPHHCRCRRPQRTRWRCAPARQVQGRRHRAAVHARRGADRRGTADCAPCVGRQHG